MNIPAPTPYNHRTMGCLNRTKMRSYKRETGDRAIFRQADMHRLGLLIVISLIVNRLVGGVFAVHFSAVICSRKRSKFKYIRY